MNVTNINSYVSSTPLIKTVSILNYKTSKNIIGLNDKASFLKRNFTTIFDVDSNDSIREQLGSKNFTGNGLLSGGTYINTVDVPFETSVILYNGDKRVKQLSTIDGRFSFNFLNTELAYDIKAIPVNKDINPKLITNLKPVVDNNSFKFNLYCYYDKKYKSGVGYTISLMVNDNRGKLTFNIDNAPTGLSINENTGIISFNISTLGVYNFTVNCSDSMLELTKSIPMQIEIIS